MADGRASELTLRRIHGRHGRTGSCCHFSESADRHLSATADERNPGQLLRSVSDHRLFTDLNETPTSSSGPTSVSSLPFMTTSVNIQTPAMSSSAQHAVSCTDPYKLKSPLPRVITNVSHASPRYQCDWEVAEKQPCGEWIEGGSKEVWSHVRTAHGLKGLYSGWCHCRWGGCLEKLRVSSLQRHLAKHLDIKWRCSSCDIVFARYDYVRRHIKFSEECHGAEVVIHLVSEQTSRTSMGQAVAGIAENSLDDDLALTGGCTSLRWES